MILLDINLLSIVVVDLVDAHQHVALGSKLKERSILLVGKDSELYVAEAFYGEVVVLLVVRNRTKLLEVGTVVEVDKRLRNVKINLILCHQLLIGKLADALCEIYGIVVVDSLVVAQDICNLDEVSEVVRKLTGCEFGLGNGIKTIEEVNRTCSCRVAYCLEQNLVEVLAELQGEELKNLQRDRHILQGIAISDVGAPDGGIN